MIILHDNNKIEVNRVTGDFGCFANITGVGKRRLYEDANRQAYVKCFNKWFQFPQQIDY